MSNTKLIAKNPTAYHNYDIQDKIEAGIVLSGTEIKSIRNGKANLKDSYAVIKKGEVYTIVEVSNGLGRLKSGAGWISMGTDYVEKVTTTSSSSSSGYQVKIVNCSVLNVRSGAGTSYPVVTTVKSNEVYTIVDESNGFGKLKSGAGWISLSYTKKI